MQWTWVNYKGQLMNYDISSDGIVISRNTGKPIAQYDHPSGYVTVCIYDYNLHKSYIVLLHRLIMMSFYYIDNHNEKEVNHIDGNKRNNNLNNLEWCNKSENAHHAYKNGLNPRAKTVYQYDLTGKLVNSYYSVSEAERQTGIKESLISGQINGEYINAGGYRWSYELNDNIPAQERVKYYKRKVVRRDKDTFEILQEYESTAEAARQTNIQQSDITRTCQGKRKTAGGFNWSYKND